MNFMYLITDSYGNHKLYTDEKNAFNFYCDLCNGYRNMVMERAFNTNNHSLLEYLKEHTFSARFKYEELEKRGKTSYHLKTMDSKNTTHSITIELLMTNE